MTPSFALGKRGEAGGVLGAISRMPVAAYGLDATTVAKKMMRSTVKAAWIAGTTFLVLGVPLLICMDCEAQLNEFQLQQLALLGRAPPLPSFAN